jgi:hypothetical protein
MVCRLPPAFQARIVSGDSPQNDNLFYHAAGSKARKNPDLRRGFSFGFWKEER